MSDLLCPHCHGVTVEHTLRRMKELIAENNWLRARVAFWRREYRAFGHLSGETLTEMDVASRERRDEPPSADAVDPHVASTGTPSTREK